jgi:hypothetical protein
MATDGKTGSIDNRSNPDIKTKKKQGGHYYSHCLIIRLQ